MAKYFTKTFQVGWTEMDADGRVGISEYFRYVVETAWAWGAANGLGMAESEAAGLAWVIRETELSLISPLRAGDTFGLTIWLEEWRRVRGLRAFEIVTEIEGRLVAQGVQEIVVLDSRSLRPVAAPEHLIDNIRMENPRIIPRRGLPEGVPAGQAAFVTQRVVEWRDLDSQQHVNNSIYPAYAQEAATRALAGMGWPPSRLNAEGLAIAIRRVHVQHQMPASWGEQLDNAANLVDLKPTGGTWYVTMERSSDREPIARCALEWSLVDQQNGEDREFSPELLGELKKKLAVL